MKPHHSAEAFLMLAFTGCSERSDQVIPSVSLGPDRWTPRFPLPVISYACVYLCLAGCISGPIGTTGSNRIGRRAVLNIHLQKYTRSDGQVAAEEMVRDAVNILSKENPTEVFKAQSGWVGHYKSGERGCVVDNWSIEALSPDGELYGRNAGSDVY